MCEDEAFGDWYRPCRHFVMKYESGERFDCNQELCGLSKAHIHKAPNCPCPKEPGQRRQIQNMFLKACDSCRNAEFARRVGR